MVYSVLETIKFTLVEPSLCDFNYRKNLLNLLSPRRSVLYVTLRNLAAFFLKYTIVKLDLFSVYIGINTVIL